ncbi:amidase clustered with urea ABC transporter and nitrile hydratase functions [Halarchaeum acidiphilum MH1-52-1]|uniref:Amidase clustered with urea ABC transporter and nitrile hydratase functions n=1 Tax=Halarchaeum acidiphilum MH1-52-1 TaxID=1261545 RepID=U3A2F5_9EURY|nr:amidase [Halarchaeum acidiphilum]GAD51814.1 amidase clustered with urea ABC transporter and nitrile hydratase functions [Halarchaeum acidiphilum MH1-52-1]
MDLRPPTTTEIERIGEDLHLNLTDEEIDYFQDLLADGLDAYQTVRDYEYSEPDVTPRMRDPGHRVQSDDPLNTWITKCEVSGDADGPLADWDVGVKDNIAVGGVEMTCGSQVMEGFVPKRDATVVSRLLDAGATIVGKTNMDDFAFTGNGHSSAFGPTLNPHDPNRLTGGSSGGSASAVAEGEVDLALGGDQGGSIRAPASWCGIVGHKPTHGLAPYTGAIGIENTVDHCGPMTQDVVTATRALTVMAGRDPEDPRQPAHVPTADYAAALTGDVSDLSIAVVEEGFEQPEHETVVNDHVQDALAALENDGATVETVSVPIHADSQDITTVTVAEAFLQTVRGEGMGHNWKGRYDLQWVDEFGKARRAQGGDFPPSVKYQLLMGAYTSERYHSKYYAKAMNLRAELTETYDELLGDYDLVAMPTTPMRAHEYKPDADIYEWFADSWSNLANTFVFDVTGHPSLSVPVEPADGLPVGLLLTGAHFDDETVLNAGYAVTGA